MKTLDLKSVLIGGLITVSGFLLISGTTNDESDSMEIIGQPIGMAIYNKQSNTLYLYKMFGGKLKDTPYQTLSIKNDGKSLEEIE